jgi:hypothetical protein
MMGLRANSPHHCLRVENLLCKIITFAIVMTVNEGLLLQCHSTITLVSGARSSGAGANEDEEEKRKFVYNFPQQKIKIIETEKGIINFLFSNLP